MVAPVTPGLSRSFSCPYCNALASQTWFELGIEHKSKDFVPTVFREDLEEWFSSSEAKDIPIEFKIATLKRARQEWTGEVFIEESEDYHGSRSVARNLNLSQCYNCDGVAVWINRKLSHPAYNSTFEPTEDMPQAVKRDFVEASKLFQISPRASAALLRVAIEELCNEINGEKMSVFKGIGRLVENGLEPKVQRALDFVRVTGNDAVHPGQINPNDTPEIAEKLFLLVNLIVETLITIPKEIDDLYDTLPEGKRAAIEKRDG